MRARSPRVLIVDDNPDVSSYVEVWLRMYGFSTSIANDGVECLEEADRQRPDVILLDLSMPRMDGFECARRLADRDWRDDVVLIAHTANSDPRTRALTGQLGFDLHLVKPTDPRQMAHAIRELSRTRRESRWQEDQRALRDAPGDVPDPD